jgi:iron complex outermembrane receptor protein
MLKTRRLRATALATLSFCAAATAQQVESLQRVEVTGSHIKRAKDESTSSVQVFRREDISRLGVSTVRELIDSLSGSSDSLSDIRGSNSFASGSSSASLRNMGKTSTLVLLNFRRVAPYPLADFNEVFTNLDALPAAAVQRVEILRNGGSSAYGSDAVAGVINIITRSDYQGLDASVTHQQGNNKGKFANSRAMITGGFGDLAKDRFNVLASLEAYTREGLPSWRDLLDDVNPVIPKKFPAFGSPSTYAWPGNVIGVGPVSGCAVVTANLCRYDRYTAFEVQPSADRVNALLSGRYLLGAELEGYSEVLFSRTENSYKSAFGIYGLGNASTWGDPRTGQARSFVHRGLPVGHPLNPTGEEVEFRYRFVDSGAGQELQTDQYRVLTGVKGQWQGWDWDVAAGAMGGTTSMALRGGISTSGFKSTIGDYDAEVLAPDFFNKAGGYKIGGVNSPEVLAKLFPNYGWDGKVTQYFIDGKMSGEIARWANGPVTLATGFDLRQERMSITPTRNLEEGDIVSLGTSRSDGKRNQGAAFVEASMPLTQQLTMEAAGRLDKYKGFDAHLSPKLGLRFQPDAAWVLRGTLEGGFRAPNLTESSTSSKFSFNNGFADPKRCPAATKLADDLQAQATPLPDSDPNKSLLLARADQVWQAECAGGVANRTLNNPNLKPETSRSISLGLVFAPSNTLNASIDYYNIERKNEIGLKTLQDLLSTEDSQPAGVVNRETDLSKDTTFRTPEERAKYGVTVGKLASTSGRFENLLKTRTSGLDFGLSTRADTRMGRLDWVVDATYLLNFQEYRSEANRWGDNLAGRYGYSRARISNLVALHSGNFVNSLRLVINSGYKLHRDINDSGWDEAACATKSLSADECRVKAYRRLDYNLSYKGFKNLTLALNVRNLLDERPPIDYRDFGSNGSNIIPQSIEDVQGRMFRVTAEYKFW